MDRGCRWYSFPEESPEKRFFSSYPRWLPCKTIETRFHCLHREPLKQEILKLRKIQWYLPPFSCLKSSFEQQKRDINFVRSQRPLYSILFFLFLSFFFSYPSFRPCKNSTTKERERGKEGGVEREREGIAAKFTSPSNTLWKRYSIFSLGPSYLNHITPRDKIIQRAATLPRIRQLCKKWEFPLRGRLFILLPTGI